MLAWTNKKIKRLLINLINEVWVNTNHKSYKIGKPVRRIIINFHKSLQTQLNEQSSQGPGRPGGAGKLDHIKLL